MQRSLRTPASLVNAFRASLQLAKINKRVTPHGLRYFFNDALRMAGVDDVSARSRMSHVTKQMQAHDSTVRLDETRPVMARFADHLKSTQVKGWVEGRAKKKKAASPEQEKATSFRVLNRRGPKGSSTI